MKRVLVAGGAGFIGSHLCKKLLMDNNKVICLDNLFTGAKDNITGLIQNPKFEFISHDVTNPIILEVDEIYNLACPASPIHYQINPIKTLETNVIGTRNLLELAKAMGAKFFQASTSEVYGDPLVHPQAEEYWGNVNPNGIRSCYDEGKRCAETLCFDYHRQHNIEIKVARIFNTYGPNMNPNDGRVISNFVTQAMGDKDITVYGRGQQTRSFCYVEDMVEGIIRIMGTSKEVIGPINLGNPNEFDMITIAERIIKKIGSKSKVVFLQLPQDDPKKRRPDITKARTILGWEPKIMLDEGLERTIEYFRNRG